MPTFRPIDSGDECRYLLRVARKTAEKELGVAGGGSVEERGVEGRFGGAFVTFWVGQKLRGCMGSFGPTDDTVGTVQEVTRDSLADRRFVSNPITAGTLKDVMIEISILSDLEPTEDPGGLIPGKHGVVIRRGLQSGCFLPQVATERGWSAGEFLSNCCTMKAGLPADAWRDRDTEVLLFTAQVFSESQFG